MLRLMLDAHSELAIPGESHFIPQVWNSRRRYDTRSGFDAGKLIEDFTQTAHFGQWDLPGDEVLSLVAKLREPSMAEVIESFYVAYASHHGKCRWGDKTPIYVLSIPLLARIFPDARFVHIIRDGRDVALSYLSVPWGPATIWQAARKWSRHVTAGRMAGRELGSTRYMEVRYEDLVKEPAQVLTRVCEFTDLPFESGMLEFHKDAKGRIQSRPERTHFHSSVTKPPSQSLRDWRTQMPAPQVLAFEAMSGAELTELGYEQANKTIPTGHRLKADVMTRALDGKIMASRVKKTLLDVVERRPPLRPAASA